MSETWAASPCWAGGIGCPTVSHWVVWAMPPGVSSLESLMTGIQYIITPAVLPRGSKMVSDRMRGSWATESGCNREKSSSRLNIRGVAGATELSPSKRLSR